MKIVNIDGENLLNDLRSFSDIFRKDKGFSLSLEDIGKV